MQTVVALALAGLGLLELIVLVRTPARFASAMPLVIAAVGGAVSTAVVSHQAVIAGATSVLFVASTLSIAHPSRGSQPAGRGSVVAVLLLLNVVAAATVDVLIGVDPRRHLIAYALAMAVAVTTLTYRLGGGIRPRNIAHVGLLVVALSDIVAVVSPSPWRACDQFKCSSLEGLYRGPYPSENYLAFLGAVALSWTLCSLQGRPRLLGSVLCVATILATGSRTGEVLGGFAILASVLLLRLRRPIARRPGSRLILSFLIVAGVTAFAFHLMDTVNPLSLDQRGLVWLQIAQAVHGHSIVGLGLSSYVSFQAAGLASIHFTQSEYLLFYFAAGYFGVVLYGAWAISAIYANFSLNERASLLGAVPVLVLVGYGLTEATWNPLALDGLTWATLAVTLAIRPRQGGSGSDETSASEIAGSPRSRRSEFVATAI